VVTQHDLSQTVERLVQDRRPSVYSKGQALITQGDAIENVFWMLSGTASCVYHSPDGRPLWLGDYGAGDLIGLDDLPEERPAKYEVRSKTAMSAVAIPKSVFLDAQESNPQLSILLNRQHSTRLTLARLAYAEVSLLSVRERIWAELLRLSRKDPAATDKRLIRPVPSFVDIAFHMNTSRETVSRTISDLAKQDTLVRTPGAIVILSPDRLGNALLTDWDAALD